MARTCGNCGTEMEDLGEGKHYCPSCDETFVITKGKQFVQKEKPNTIDRLKDGQKNLNERVSAVEENLEIESREAFPGF